MKSGYNSEEQEQAEFVGWLERKGLLFSATANGAWQSSYSQRAKLHRTGVRKGLPDIFIVIKPEQSHDGKGYLLAVEMKIVKGGVATPEQKEWISAINTVGDHCGAYIAKGAYEAKQIIEPLLKSIDNESTF